MPSLRYEIERDIALLLGEDVDSPGYREPMWLRRVAINACNEVARHDCYWAAFTLSTTGTPAAPMASVCLPRQLYKLKQVIVTLASGAKVLLEESRGIYTPSMANRLWCSWQTSPSASSTPQALILKSPESVLYPLPNWTGTDNIRFEGFAEPGDNWANDPNGAITDSDPFPLPEFCRAAVVYVGARLRCIQSPTKENQVRYEWLSEHADEQLGFAERDAATAYQRGTLQGRTS